MIKIDKYQGRHSEMLKIEDIHIGQTPKVADYFKDILEDFQNIVEIGTHRGGFTLLLNSFKSSKARLTSFEINKENIDSRILENYSLDISIGNCFTSPTKEKIIKEIANEGKTLLLCDGGRKNEEFNTFAYYLKQGDVIMLHDYSHSSEMWNKYAKLAKWRFAPESSYTGIKNTVADLNLQQYEYEKFCSVFWGSFIRS